MNKDETRLHTSSPLDLQGHRGARGLLPENSIPAFLKALELGVTTLEMDAVISQDLQVVVSHEPWFNGHICNQPSGSPVPVDEDRSFNLFELPYHEIARFDCGSRGNPAFPRQEKMRTSKPLLSAVIDAAEAYADTHGLPPVLYNIETKSSPARDGIYHPDPETFTRLLYEVISEKEIVDRATIQSFDPRTLRVARSLNPELSLALLVANHDQLDFEGHVERLGFTPAIYSPHYELVDRTLVEAAHEKDMLIIPWTVNTMEEMRNLVELGVDGLITDYPDIGVSLLHSAD